MTGGRVLTPEERLIVALDVDADRIDAIVRGLPLRTFKIGMEAFYREGAPLVRRVREQGRCVFLDLKLHDIPSTVARAVTVVAGLGVSFLTVHASGGREMIAAAAGAARAAGELHLLAVTVLTSFQGNELPGVWDPRVALGDKVVRLARMAIEAGCQGVVASPLEARILRATLGPEPIIVCPGIRPAGTGGGDQRRIATPADAVGAGADYLVVGRPITGAPDPLAAARALLAEIQDAQR